MCLYKSLFRPLPYPASASMLITYYNVGNIFRNPSPLSPMHILDADRLTSDQRLLYEAGIRAGRQSLRLSVLFGSLALVKSYPVAALPPVSDIGTVARLVIEDTMPNFETYPD